jgi:hypothetical protein
VTGSKKKQWADLTPAQQGAIAAAGAVQIALAATAWWDLAHRPASGVRGPKAAWALGIAVNTIGPIAYFTLGRIKPRAGKRRGS